MKTLRLSLPQWLAGPLGLSLMVLSASAATKVDFARDIRPILTDNCFSCHGPDDKTRKGGLRLDIPADALKPAKSGARAIVPGDPDHSELLKRISHADPDQVMPPPKSKKVITPAQVETLRQWIADGAQFQVHWAFSRPERPPVPATRHPGSVRNEIDSFVLARLEAEGLTPMAEADRVSLIRRVTFDLTGLPPTPAEVDAYLADPSPDAYEKVVDRLLQSPRYGEHQARFWLDAVRYADSHGYHIDSQRDIWAYREWVINSFNDNLPFDQFTIDQLAGDLLPNPTVEQKTGSGYVRCNMSTGEGGAIEDEYLSKYTFDRTETTGTIWLGLTLVCSRCHTHKYDPISHKEYYGLYAYFHSLNEPVMDGNKPNPDPFLKLPSAAQTRRLEDLKGLMADTQKKLEAPMPELDRAQIAWTAKWHDRLSAGWNALAPAAIRATSTNGVKFATKADQSIVASGPNAEQDVYEVTLQPGTGTIAALRLEALPDPSLPLGASGRATDGRFRLSEFEAEIIAPGTDGKPGKPAKIAIAQAVASAEEGGFEIAKAIDGKADTGWGLGTNAIHNPQTALFVLGDPVRPGTNAELRIRLRFEASKSGRALGHFRLSAARNDDLVELLNPPKLSPWQVVGPFKSESLQQGLTNVFAPEKEIDLKKSYPGVREEIRWQARAEFADGRPNLLVNELHGVHGVYYLHRTIQAGSARRIELSVRADDRFKLWVNDRLVAERASDPPTGDPPIRVAVDLKKGDNKVLLKVVNHVGAAYFSFAKEGADAESVPADIAAILATSAQAPGAAADRVRTHFRRAKSPAYKELGDNLEQWKTEQGGIERAIPTTMVAREMDKPRDTFMLLRGEYDKKGDKVTRGVPAIIGPLSVGQPTNRLQLARWLLDPANPLTARVTVNRYWQQYFGTGIVKTTEDFGVQGEAPSHPALLDWLATDFIASGWNLKHLHRLIATSATYRQSSHAPAALRARDPENRLLARGPRFRLDGEVLRDSALSVGGLLVEQRGGRSVKPYEPPGLWEAVSFNNAQKYVPETGRNQYRRSLYTFWKRQSPPPNMLLFDAPTREVCTVRRPRTNTPLQALAMLNDPQFVEASRACADRILREGGADAESRIRYAFRLITSRSPDAREVALVRQILDEQLATYRGDKAAAEQLGKVGPYLATAGNDPAEVAAWTTVASMLLNLDEAVTKG